MLTEVLSDYEIKVHVFHLSAKLRGVDEPCVWVVMDGTFMFATDMLRHAPNVKEVKFFYVRRGYGQPGGPHDPMLFHIEPPVFLTKYTHVFLDVISEEGKTFERLLELVPERRRKHVITCALVQKGSAYAPTWVGKHLDTKEHLTGYGMGPYRWLPYIAERRKK